ncbi:NtaA/DmoA family FMN-dependent monooxygenase [Streptomyces sp. NPDC000594]|uniref:NtaA/DmoA family FMN-dependent monooxygenase n=1 Tax=Streptomyces sp. NPDC000594 TaxID=3154261 RepID=UPI00331FE503
MPDARDARATAVPAGDRDPGRIAFSAFGRLARTAERGLFDFVLLPDGRRARERHTPGHETGRETGHDHGATGRPEPLTVLSALAAVTERIGLAAAVDLGRHEPYELARRLASLDHLSGGRAAWSVVTSVDPFAGADRRQGGADHAEQHARAEEFVRTARALWDSWTPDGRQRPLDHRGRHFSVAGEFTVARSPQGHPVVIQSGGSHAGRELAAKAADVVLSRHRTLASARAFAADLRGRFAAQGRDPAELTVMPGVTVVLGDSAADARERAAALREGQLSPAGAIAALERIWGRDLSGHDPEGPLPEIDPAPGGGPPARCGGRTADGPAVAERLRALSRRKGLTSRQTVAEVTARQTFVGTPEQVAAEMAVLLRERAADGFLLLPQPTPGGLDDFVARVVPLLQERGILRTGYEGSTLRSHLGLAEPVWKG